MISGSILGQEIGKPIDYIREKIKDGPISVAHLEKRFHPAVAIAAVAFLLETDEVCEVNGEVSGRIGPEWAIV